MADASPASHPRPSPFRILGAALLATSILLASGGANAATNALVLQFPAKSIVDKGFLQDTGNYLTQDDDFWVRSGVPTGSLTPLLVQEFLIPSTPPVLGGEFFSFEIEDPQNPGSLAGRQDIPFTWNKDDGGVVSDTFRAKLTFHSFGTELTSFYDLTLTTDPVAAIGCPPANPVNSHAGLTGQNLPSGPLPPEGADLVLVASACAVEESGVANDLSGYIVALQITARLSPPTVPALSPPGWAALGTLLVAFGCWTICGRAATAS